MELQQILNSNATTSGIQLTVTDKAKATKQALLLFNPDDNWFEHENATSADVLSHFAGGLFHTLETDKDAVLLQCTAFHVKEGIVRKGISFCPMVKDDGRFKSCIIYKDGTIEML